MDRTLKYSRYTIRCTRFGGVELKKGLLNFACSELNKGHCDGRYRVERRLGILVIKIGIGSTGLCKKEGVVEDDPGLFLQEEKKNGKSFVRQLWLRIRRSEIQCEMKQ